MMEDEKLHKDCRVTVTDLRSILPPTMLAHLIVPIQQDEDDDDDEDVEILSDGIERSRLSSPIKNSSCSVDLIEPVPKTDLVQNVSEMNAVSKVGNINPKVRTSVKTVKNLNIYKNKRSISNSNKRRGHHVNSNSLSSAQAKNRLMQKYGSTLLRKPSFVVEPDLLEESSSQESSSSGNGGLSSQEVDEKALNPISSVSEVAQEILVQEQNTCSNTSKRSSSGLPVQNFDNQENEVQNLKLEDVPLLDSIPINPDLNTNSGQLLSETIRPMPPVGLSVNVGVGHKLPTLQAKCVLTCLEKCETSLTPQFAEFSSSVVKSSSQSPLSKILIPIDDERVLQFMRIKWQSRPDLQKLTFSIPKCDSETMQEVTEENKELLGDALDKNVIVDAEKVSVESVCDKKKTVRRKRKRSLIPRPDDDALNDIDVSSTDHSSVDNTPRKRPLLSSYTRPEEELITTITENRGNNSSKRKRLQCIDNQNLADSDDETRNVALKSLEKFPLPLYDPDDSRGIQSSETQTKECKQAIRGRKSHLMYELRRLNVAVFDMPNNQEQVTCRNSDICRLGCVCNSLTISRTVRDHCGLEKCMFSCDCVKSHLNAQSTSDPSYAWMHNKAKANLAKEEKHFKQTVVRSEKDGLVLVEGRRKREIKVPNRYREDFVADLDFKPCHQLKSMRSVKGVLQESQIPDRVSNSPKSPKANRIPEEIVSEKEVIDVYKSSSEDAYEVSKSQDPEFSARTISYDFKAREDRQEKQKQLLKDSSGEKIKTTSDLKIVSTQSVNADEWEKSDSRLENVSNLELSCSALFKPSPTNGNKPVRLLSWKNLREDIDRKKAFVWMKLFPTKPQMSITRPKIYLTCSNVMPANNCIDIQSINVHELKFRELPFHLKSLRSDYTLSVSEGQCVWIVKSIKNNWMIVGYMQPGQRKHSVGQNPDVDILSPEGENVRHKWWVMDVRQYFDLIYFMDFKKAITKDQISTLVKLSNEYSESETKVHRILLNRRRPKIDPRPTPYPDFGAYSLPSHPTKVLIGPYDFSKEPRFHVYAQFLHAGKIEYEKIPLFYCGGGEFVRVNAQGALSLHRERPPEKYVQGSWYESSGTDFRSFDAHTLSPNPTTDYKVETGCMPQIEIEADCVDNESEASFKMLSETCSDPASDESNGGDSDSVQASEKREEPEERHFESVSFIREDIMKPMAPTAKQSLPEPSDNNRGGPKDTHVESVSVLKVREDIAQPKVPTAKQSLPGPSDNRGGHEDKRVDSVSLIRVREDIMQPKVPSAPQLLLKKEVDPRVLKNMPHVSIDASPPHTTLLKSKQNFCEEISLDDDCEDVPELTIEYLVPSVKALGVLPVTYLPTDALSVPHFTQPGLLQFFHSREELIQEINRLIHFKLACLNQKCCVVLKSDDFCRCIAWRTVWDKEKCAHLPQFSPEIFNGYFMLTKYGLVDIRTADRKYLRRVGEDWVNWLKEDELKAKLNAWEKEENEGNGDSSSVSQSGAMKSANKEILKNCSESRPLHNDNRAKRIIMKDTLIASLTRKLNGIPGSVIPNFLELLDFDILLSSHQLMSNLSEAMIMQTKTTTSQHLSTSIDKRPMFKSSVQRDENNITDRQSPSPRKDVVNGKDGLACRLSPFSRLNICVEEGGIKYAPLSSPPQTSSPVELLAELPTSPGKQPNILRRNKSVLLGKTGPFSGAHSTKQSRKQTFSASSENDEEPVFLKVPENSPTELGLKERMESNLSNIDHIVSRSNVKTKLLQMSKPTHSTGLPNSDRNCSSSSAVISLPQTRDCGPPLKISSIGSGASFWNESSKPSSICPETQAKVQHPPVPSSNSAPALQISSVYSTSSPSPSALSTQTELNSGVNPESSLQISSVSSGANAVMMLNTSRRGKSLLTTTRKIIKADSSVLAIMKSKAAGDLSRPVVSGISDSGNAPKQQSLAEGNSLVEEEMNNKVQNIETSSKKMKLQNSDSLINKRLEMSDNPKKEKSKNPKKLKNSESSLDKESQNSDDSVSMELQNSESSKKKKLQGSKSLTKKRKLQNSDCSMNKEFQSSENLINKGLQNLKSSMNKVLQNSEIAEIEDLQSSESSVNKELQSSDSPQTTELPKSDCPQTTELPKSDCPQTTESPKSDCPQTTELPKSDCLQTKELPKSDCLQTKEMPKSDCRQTKELPKSDSPQTKEFSKSESSQSKELQSSESSLSKILQNPTKTLKILKRGSDSVTVTVPISALRILPPNSVDKKLEANLLRWAKESLNKIEQNGNDRTEKLNTIGSTETCEK